MADDAYDFIPEYARLPVPFSVYDDLHERAFS